MASRIPDCRAGGARAMVLVMARCMRAGYKAYLYDSLTGRCTGYENPWADPSMALVWDGRSLFWYNNPVPQACPWASGSIY